MFDAFYSDPHFGHARVIEYSNRPFADVREMNDRMIDLYNATVGHDDVVLWLGDCFLMRFEEAEEIMRELRGKKVLVRGNHDRSARRMAALGFAAVVDELALDLNGVPARACHYPYRRSDTSSDVHRPERRKGEVLLHGHTHLPQKVRGGMPEIHCGVDAWDYRPATFEEVAAIARGLV